MSSVEKLKYRALEFYLRQSLLFLLLLTSFGGSVWAQGGPDANCPFGAIAQLEQLKHRAESFDSYGVQIVHPHSQAKVAMLHPRFAEGVDLEAHPAWFSFDTGDGAKSIALKVPPETGRAALDPKEELAWDDLIKGTGRVEKNIEGNKLRPATRDFNGRFEISEGFRDAVNTEILQRAGLRSAQPRAIIDLGMTADFGGFQETAANYVRRFRFQTRVSNLAELGATERKVQVDAAMASLRLHEGAAAPKNYEEYFDFMLRQAAKNAAILQGTGFTQDSLHFGQMTLAGELVDLGIGQFDSARLPGVKNALHDWFRFERQPLLFLNMLYKTHSVKAEPFPVRLGPDSATFKSQDSLFGFIRSFDPEAASRILASDPEKKFWKYYEEAYSRFDSGKFQKDVLDHRGDFYKFDPSPQLSHLDPASREKVEKRFQEKLAQTREHYEKQELTWARNGLTAAHQETILQETLQELGLPAREAPRPSMFTGTDGQFFGQAASTNQLFDPSWRPLDRIARIRLDSFAEKHPAQVAWAKAPDGRDVLIVSTKGLEGPARKTLENDYAEAIKDFIVPIQQPGQEHLLLATNGNVVDLNLRTTDPTLQVRNYRLPSKSRLEPLIMLPPAERYDWDSYVQNVTTNTTGTLGPQQSNFRRSVDYLLYYAKLRKSHPATIDTRDLRTAGQANNNRFLGNCTHNCTSWVSTAPIQGRPLHEILGMPQEEVKDEAATQASKFVNFVQQRADPSRVPAMVYISDLDPQSARQQLLQDFANAPKSASPAP
jgi:hypothetical protein